MHGKNVEEYKRVVYFQGSNAFAGRELSCPDNLFLGESELGSITIVSIVPFHQPKEMKELQAPPDDLIAIDLRCAHCVKAFTDENSLSMHWYVG